MSEIYKCPACYRKYDLQKGNQCPGCGQTPQQARGEEPLRSNLVADLSRNVKSQREPTYALQDADLAARVIPKLTKISQSPKSKREQIDIDKTDPLVAAVNRATKAVRSLAIFFFLSLTTSLIGIPLIWVGLTRESTELLVGGVMVSSIGFITALLSGILELRDSRF